MAPAIRSRVGAGPVVFFILLIGFALRLALLLTGRPLWLDEAMLANNIRTHSILALFQPLDNHQGAPIGFLILERLLWNCLHTDWSLRLVSLGAGCAMLPLIDLIAKQVLSGAGRILAVLLSATSLPLIYYSTEIKPYALDAAIALWIIVCALRWAEQRSGRALLALGLSGAITVWFSYAAIFVLAAVGLTLLVEAMSARDPRVTRQLSGVGAAWLLSFGVVYALTMRHLSHDSILNEYWQEGFMPYSQKAGSWAIHSLMIAFRTPGAFQSTKLAAVAAVIGAIWLWRNHELRLGGMLVLAVLIPLVAAMAHQYPFAGRLILFIVPIEIILITCGVTGFPQRFGGVGMILSLLLAAFLFRQTATDLPALFLRGSAAEHTAANHLAELGIPPHEDVIGAMDYLRGVDEPDRDLYLVDVALPAYEYYTATRGSAHPALKPSSFREETEVQTVISKIAAHPRAAILLSHLHEDLDEPALDLRMILAINGAAMKSHEIKFAGSRVILVDPQ